MRGTKFFGIGVTLIVCILALLLVSWGSDAAAAPAQPGPFAPDHILVKFRAGVDIARLHAANKTKTINIIPRIDVHVVSIPPGRGVQEMVEQFEKIHNVEYAEPDYIAYPDLVPDDTYFDEQWGMNNTGQTRGTPDADIDAPEAWDTATGAVDAKIAILDTGIKKEHEDLGGKVVYEANFTTSPTSDDLYGHGTHCAGIAAAVTNNATGVAGVGFNCSLMNVKVLHEDGYGTYEWAAAGIIDAADEGANVISMSFGGSEYSETVEGAVNYAWGAGVVLVASAGNQGTADPRYPAYYTNCIAVAAIDDDDLKASWSTYGDWVDVAAPGVNIYSTTLPYKYRGKIVHYGYKSGTSMSAPHVAGLAGLVWATSYGTSNSAVRYQIESTADEIAGTGTDWIWGRINAHKAVTPPEATGSIAGTVTDANTTNPIANATVTANGYSTTTATDGTYALDVPVGSYTVTALADGHVEESKTADVLENQPTVVDFALAPALGNENDMYVWSIDFSKKTAGPNTFLYVTVTINRDSNANGVAEELDAEVSLATVSLRLDNQTTGQSWTGQGDTDDSGQITFQVNKAPSGTYVAEVTGLTHATYTWNSALDHENPSDPYTLNGAQAAAAPPISVNLSKNPPVLLREIKKVHPVKTVLFNAYPSPANPETWIPFVLNKEAEVSITIYNVTGKLVRTLSLGYLNAGVYVDKGKAAYWDGRNANGERVSSGVYFYLMEAGNFRAMKKMVILK